MGKMEKWIVDRTEGTRVICEAEDGSLRELPLAAFDAPPADGSVIRTENGRAVPDTDATEARRRQMEERFRRLVKK